MKSILAKERMIKKDIITLGNVFFVWEKIINYETISLSLRINK